MAQRRGALRGAPSSRPKEFCNAFGSSCDYEGMRNQEHIADADLLATWQADLRGSLVSGLDPDRVELLAAGIAAMAGSTALATASAVATQGGTHMLETTTAATAATNAAAGVTAGATGATAGAAATGSLGAKIAAGALAASLVGGGTAALTGNLPNGMQSFVADAAAHIGLDLPRPEVNLDIVGGLDAGLGVGEVVDLGVAGRLSATVDATAGLVLTGIEEAAGFTARVVSETSDSVMVQFESATESATVLLTQVDGQIVASITGDASAGTSQSTDGGVDAGAEAGTSGSIESDGASVDAESNTRIQIGIGTDG